LGVWFGVWGFGGWGLGPNPQSPIPNPQSPIPNPHIKNYNKINIIKINLIINLKKYFNFFNYYSIQKINKKTMDIKK
jgi:hypothetical protein